MNNERNGDDRILARILGEAAEQDRAEIEAELRARPEIAAEYERLVEEVRAWAKEPVNAPPLCVEELVKAAAAGRDKSAPEAQMVPRPSRLRGWAWAMAAAALLLLALSQVSFQIRFGQSEFHWGKRSPGLPSGMSADLTQLSREITECRKAIQDNARQIQTVALQGRAFEEEARVATERLVRLQQAETQTRYQDVEKLIHLVSFAGPGLP